MKISPAELRSRAAVIAKQSINKHSRQKVSEHDVEVMQQTVAEARLHRMLMPRILEGTSLSYLLTRRFPVEQIDSKGRLKLRMIDDLADSQVNDACHINRQIRMGRISDLAWGVNRLSSLVSEPLLLAKSDFSNAYRHCPIRSEDLDLAHILLKDGQGRLFQSQQFAMPFGAVAAVYAWDRLGSSIASIVLELLDIPVNRYVDDLFWVDFADIASESRDILLEVVSLLGLTLAVDKTPAPASSQEVLGVACSLKTSEQGLHFSFLQKTANSRSGSRRLSRSWSPRLWICVGSPNWSVASASPPGPFGARSPDLDFELLIRFSPQVLRVIAVAWLWIWSGGSAFCVIHSQLRLVPRRVSKLQSWSTPMLRDRLVLGRFSTPPRRRSGFRIMFPRRSPQLFLAERRRSSRTRSSLSGQLFNASLLSSLGNMLSSSSTTSLLCTAL